MMPPMSFTQFIPNEKCIFTSGARESERSASPLFIDHNSCQVSSPAKSFQSPQHGHVRCLVNINHAVLGTYQLKTLSRLRRRRRLVAPARVFAVASSAAAAAQSLIKRAWWRRWRTFAPKPPTSMRFDLKRNEKKHRTWTPLAMSFPLC